MKEDGIAFATEGDSRPAIAGREPKEGTDGAHASSNDPLAGPPRLRACRAGGSRGGWGRPGRRPAARRAAPPGHPLRRISSPPAATGFDVELMRRFARRLGVSTSWCETDWPEALPDLLGAAPFAAGARPARVAAAGDPRGRGGLRDDGAALACAVGGLLGADVPHAGLGGGGGRLRGPAHPAERRLQRRHRRGQGEPRRPAAARRRRHLPRSDRSTGWSGPAPRSACWRPPARRGGAGAHPGGGGAGAARRGRCHGGPAAATRAASRSSAR